MNKEILLLIEICEGNKEFYSANELAAFLNLKYVEGVYPYLNKLLKLDMLIRPKHGFFAVNNSNIKVQIVNLLLKVFGKDAYTLFSNDTRRILEKFSIKPIQLATGLPYNNLRKIKDIAKKTKIIYSVKEGNKQIYFLRSWEEPTKKLLQFFDITIKFDEEEHRQTVIKHFAAFTGNQTHLKDKSSVELIQENLSYYLAGGDFILDKLSPSNPIELSIIDGITQQKKSKMSKDLFSVYPKINEWKIKYVYNTDKIEGNPLTMDEVKTILTLGAEALDHKDTVISDKKVVLETSNSKTAIDNIFDMNNELDMSFIKRLHFATQQGIDQDAGEFKKDENCVTDDTGTLIDRTTPAQFVEERMESLLHWYAAYKDKLHPLVLASVVHNQFAYIHPFRDGNGRVARLLFNFILIKNAYFPIIFYNIEKPKYYSHLRLSKHGQIQEFVKFCIDLYRTQIDEF